MTGATTQQDALTNNETFVSVIPMSEARIVDVRNLHRKVFTEYMNVRLGSDYLDAFLNWFCKSVQGVALVAVNRDAEVLGYIVGAPVGYARPMNRELLFVVAKAMMLRPWLLFDSQIILALIGRLKHMFGRNPSKHLEPSLPCPTMSLVSVAVAPHARGRKIGHCLVKEFEKVCRMQKMGSLRLSVYSGNVLARQFYELCGWKEFSGPRRKTGELYYFRILP